MAQKFIDVCNDGNVIIDATFHNIEYVKELDKKKNLIVRVICTSIFVDKVTKVIIAGKTGIEIML